MSWGDILKVDYPDYIGFKMEQVAYGGEGYNRTSDVYGIFSHVVNGGYTLEPGERPYNQKFWRMYQPYDISLSLEEALTYALLLDKPHLFGEYNTHEPLGLKIWGGRYR